MYMKIWKLNFELDLFDNFVPDKEFTVEEIHSFDGRTKLRNWVPIKVKRMEPEKNLALSDAPGFLFPVFSQKALECLYPMIKNYVEVLPLKFEENDYFGINVINVLDAIDYEKADYKTFRDGKRIMAFRKYAFLSSAVRNMPIFKITDEKTRYAFVSSDFKKTVEDNGLIGFKFELVWDSEKS